MTAPPEIGLERAREWVRRFEGRRVLVVGDVMLDRFVWGSVHRISPEAPVPVVRVDRESVHLGGAANVAANLAALGARVTLASVVGDDEAGEQLGATLAERGIEPRLVRVRGRMTTVKSRIVARSQQVARVDHETEAPIDPATREEVERQVRLELGESQAVALSDYDKGLFSPELLGRVLTEARLKEIPVVADAKPTWFDAFQPVTVITPNQAEAARVAAMEIRTDQDCVRAAERILERVDARAVLITRGDHGVLLLERGGTAKLVPAVALEVFDVTGAGDTVAAVLAASFAAGVPLLDAAVLANHAGGVVVGKVGTATASPAEILAHVARTSGSLPA